MLTGLKRSLNMLINWFDSLRWKHLSSNCSISTYLSLKLTWYNEGLMKAGHLYNISTTVIPSVATSTVIIVIPTVAIPIDYFTGWIFTLIVTPAPIISTVQFQIPSINVNESDGSVIVNLVRAGNNSDNITVCIAVTMVVEPAISQRMYKLCIYSLYVSVQCIYVHTYIIIIHLHLPFKLIEQRGTIQGLW